MVLSTREELHLLIDKLPESEVEKLLNIIKEDNISEKFVYTNLTEDLPVILNEDAELLKRLAE